MASLRNIRRLTSLLAAVSLAFSTATAWSHMAWVLLPEPGTRQFSVVFSEGLQPDDPEYLKKLADAAVTLHGIDGQRTTVTLKMAEDRLVGTIPDNFDAIAIEVPVTWGVIARGGEPFMLKYRAIGLLDIGRMDRLQLNDSTSAVPFVRLTQKDNEVLAQARVGIDPLADTVIKIIGGSESQELTTDSQGMATWKLATTGNYGLYAKSSSKETGEADGMAFSEVRTYITISVRLHSAGLTTTPDTTHDVKAQTVPASELGTTLPELPFGITSFGAAGIGDSIYVYGGHTGSAHSYWNTSQSNQLLRWNLKDADSRWEVVSEGAQRLQGLAMVAHETRLILVGGFFAKNEEGEPHQLYSQDQVAVFDTATNQWTELPKMPSGRSSHDAIVHEDKLYVVGGWNMSGPDSTQWHDTAIVLDLKAKTPTWEELPKPGFNRRALALAAFEGKIFAIGGMEQQGQPTRKTSVFDPLTQQWSDGPELVGTEDMVGFGASSWPINGRLLTTTYDGSVQVLSADHKSWLAIGQTDDARFFHRMLPFRAGQLVLVGGSNMESGKFLQPEVIRIETTTGVTTR